MYFSPRAVSKPLWTHAAWRRRGRVPRLSSLVAYELFAHRHPNRSGRVLSRRILAGVNKAHGHHKGLPSATRVAMRCNLDDLTDEGRSLKTLLEPESFSHQPLQAGLIEEIEGEFFFGEHGEGGALGSGGEFGGFLHGKARILADHRQDHAHHQLQATDFAGLFFFFLGSVVRRVAGFFFGEREVSIAAGVARYLHVAPFAQVLLIQLC
jgi:hypothetical protein